MPKDKPRLTEAGQRRVTENIGLAYKMVSKYVCEPFFPKEDAVGVAMVALCRAAAKFIDGTPSKHHDGFSKFSFYACVAIERDLAAAKKRAFRNGLSGRISETGIRAMEFADGVESSDIMASDWPCPLEEAETADQIAMVMAAVEWLRRKNANAHLAVSRLMEGRRLRDVGAELGTSKEWVRQLQNQGIRMIREHLGVTA